MHKMTSYSYIHLSQKMPLFGSSKKSPTEIVKIVKDSFAVLDKDDAGKKSDKVSLRPIPMFQQS